MKITSLPGITLITTLLLLPCGHSIADDGRAEFEQVRSEVKAGRQRTIASNLPLSSEEAHHFWPLYRQYQQARDELVERRIDNLETYYARLDSLSEQDATLLLDNYLKLQEDFLSLKKRYVGKFGKILSQRKTLRYFQLEHRLDAMVEDELAQSIPLPGETSAADSATPKPAP